MSFMDDLGAGTYHTKTTTIGAGVPSYWWDKRFLELLVPDLRLMQFMDIHPLPEGNGITAELTRPRPLDRAMTALTEAVNPNGTLMYDQKVNVSLAEYGAWVPVSSLAYQAHIRGMIPGELLGATERLASQAARTMEMLLKYELNSNGIQPTRADADTTKTYSGTLTSVTSTTAIADTSAAANTNYGDTNDDWNQSILYFTSGRCKGQARTVSDYVTSGGAITLGKALDMTPEVGDTFTVVSADAIAAADDLSYTNIKVARKNLVNEYATPFPGGDFVGMMSVEQEMNLMDDTDWKAVQTYKDRTTGIEDGFVKRFCGIKWYEMPEPFAFPITTIGTAGTSYGPGTNGANYSATGTVHTALIFGRHSFAGFAFTNKSGQLKTPPVKIKGPNKYDKADMLDRWAGAGWVIEAAFKSLWALHCQGIWTYAS